MKRVGFVIDSTIPSLASVHRGSSAWRHLIRGQYTGSSVALMRFRWVADWVNRHHAWMHYELYRPWRNYDAVIFLKSMGMECALLAQRLTSEGTRVLFDCNVDYLTPPSGKFYYDGMAPREDQQEACRRILEVADDVIADSTHIRDVLSAVHSSVAWIPDNVRDDLIAGGRESRRGGPLVLQWSGEAVKLFDLLILADVLPRFGDQIELRLVTGDLTVLRKWPDPQQQAFQKLLASVPHRIIPFESIEQLMGLYDSADVVLSPRFLDNSYNLGHTEWKITLGMARGCVALCSPQRSYQDVAAQATGGIRVCRSNDEWVSAFTELMNVNFEWRHERLASLDVVRSHYRTSVVANQHVEWLRSACDAGERMTSSCGK